MMFFSAIPNIMVTPESVQFIGQLGYPAYLIPFLGVAKLLGVIAIVIPGFPQLKEWAYAGLVIDLTGAYYSLLSVSQSFVETLPMFLIFALAGRSYFFYHKKLKEESLRYAKA